MITPYEKIIFAILAMATLVATWFAVRRLARLITAGSGKPDWHLIPRRLWNVVSRVAIFQPVFRLRFWPSLFHALVGWGFLYYLLVNVIDVIHTYLPGFVLPGLIGLIYLFLADVLSVAVLVGMFFFILRRFIFKPANLSARESTLILPKARAGIRRDSAIVASFIVIHVGSRFVGEALAIAARQHTVGCHPFVSLSPSLFVNLNPQAITLGEHITFWLALGTIMAFIPYFPYSKHIHLFFAPLNFLLKPERRSIGEMSYVNIEDPTVESFGAAKLSDLGWEQLMDAYSCIMCFRCQEVCPAYQTGKVLSPAALEINKRYLLNGVNDILPQDKLVESVIPPEAIWACTSCGACVDICPVGNEPMRDILDIRRNLSLMENAFPKQLEAAFRGMERVHNPWGVPVSERMKWAEGLPVPTIAQNPTPDILWWVGCAPAIDPRAQKTARAFASILLAARVNFAVLGENEQCTGDAARRAGREDIFFMLAQANVEQLNKAHPKLIVTTCPHCLHTLKNEYPAFGGNYKVIHHSELIAELIKNHQLVLRAGVTGGTVTFHDPCYLGRQNGITQSPRDVLGEIGLTTKEMAHHAEKSFCCGAGGAQAWKEEEPGTERISTARLAEARLLEVQTLAVGCPFCLTMLEDAAKQGGEVEIKDLAELVASRL